MGRELNGKLRVTALVLLCVLVTAAAAWQSHRYDFLSDDAFISFRYARNFAAGEGLVFNPGERVEGYTNLLYVLVLAALARCGADLVVAGRAIGVLSTAALALLTFAVVVRLGRRDGIAFGAVAAAALLANPFLAIWTGGGLETPLFSALVMALAYAMIVAAPDRRTFTAVSVVGVALTLTRPEGVAVYGLAACWALLAWRFSWRQRLAALGPGVLLFVAGVAALSAWRLWYYGDLLPNTFYVKSGFSALHLQRGLAYVGAFARNGAIPAAALLGVIGVVLQPGRATLFLAALLTTLVAAVIAVGGDGLPAYRFMVPALAPLFCLAALGLHALYRRLGSRAPVGAVLMLLGVGLAVWSASARADIFYLLHLEQKEEVAAWKKAGLGLRANLPPGTSIAAAPIGALGYYSQLPVIDMMGLTDRHIARVAVAALGSGQAGHEKHDGPYVLSRRPGLLLLANIFVSPEPATNINRMYAAMSPAVLAREWDIVSNEEFLKNYRYRAFALGEGLYLHAFARITP
jgi:hypothetical protein